MGFRRGSVALLVNDLGQVDARFWHGRRVLVTGHTGFKGAWLSLWLQDMGAEIYGLSRRGAHRPGPV